MIIFVIQEINNRNIEFETLKKEHTDLAGGWDEMAATTATLNQRIKELVDENTSVLQERDENILHLQEQLEKYQFSLVLPLFFFCNFTSFSL